MYWVAVYVRLVENTYTIHLGSGEQPKQFKNLQWLNTHTTYKRALVEVKWHITEYESRGMKGLGVIDHGPVTNQEAF